jgi:hypothetical protein
MTTNSNTSTHKVHLHIIVSSPAAPDYLLEMVPAAYEFIGSCETAEKATSPAIVALTTAGDLIFSSSAGLSMIEKGAFNLALEPIANAPSTRAWGTLGMVGMDRARLTLTDKDTGSVAIAEFKLTFSVGGSLEDVASIEPTLEDHPLFTEDEVEDPLFDMADPVLL